jgi:protein-S-isoprenylcysteine O-methyltransferase Ste14
MTRTRRTGWISVLLNLTLFLVFLDVVAHQVVKRLLALEVPLDRWYAAALAPAAGQPLTPGWYSVYWDASWLARADWRRMDLTDWSFAAQTLALCAVVLVRRRHVALDRNLSHQALALFAFGSGAFFMGEPLTVAAVPLLISRVLVITANVVGVATLLNLGRSFGILIALRRVETGGLYSCVRHPMYGSDILLKAGFLVGHPTSVSLALFVIATAAYVYRAVLEERFLDRDPAYREYRQKVRFRFIPGVF